MSGKKDPSKYVKKVILNRIGKKQTVWVKINSADKLQELTNKNDSLRIKGQEINKQIEQHKREQKQIRAVDVRGAEDKQKIINKLESEVNVVRERWLSNKKKIDKLIEK